MTLAIISSHTTTRSRLSSNILGLTSVGQPPVPRGYGEILSSNSKLRVSKAIALCLAVALWPTLRAGAQEVPSVKHEPEMEADPSPLLLETGFQKLYELNFEGARKEFLEYQKVRPDDPMGKVAEAASYLYEQFDAKGVLTSEFFLNDQRFLGGIDGNPAQNRNTAFLNTNHQAREMSKKRIKADPHDLQGLLSLTIADGMESNYDAMIEKKPMAALSMMKQGEQEANAALAVDPSVKDAYVALGMSNYVIGCLPSYKRAFLWFGGVHGDRMKGIDLMQSAADHGRYLSPFAKIMLALAYEREHQPEKARVLLQELSAQFPANPIFARELALVDHNTCCKR
jgi:hypothetical protein